MDVCQDFFSFIFILFNFILWLFSKCGYKLLSPPQFFFNLWTFAEGFWWMKTAILQSLIHVSTLKMFRSISDVDERMHSDWPAAFDSPRVCTWASYDPLYILVLFGHKFIEVNIYTFYCSEFWKCYRWTLMRLATDYLAYNSQWQSCVWL